MELTIRFNKETLKGLFIGLVLSSAVWGPVYYLAANQAKNQGNTAPAAAGEQKQEPSPAPAPPAKAEFKLTAMDHLLGKADAPVVLVEFSDFQCPYCSRHHQTMNKIIETYGDKIAWAWKHYPLSFHQYAQKASEASECASEQGKFWEYANKLMENQTNLNEALLPKLAKDLKLDEAKFKTCLDEEKYKNKVLADLNEGTTKGVEGTPATFVNGELLSGAIPFDSFKQIIDQLLTK